jgi:hypothetical protein
MQGSSEALQLCLRRRPQVILVLLLGAVGCADARSPSGPTCADQDAGTSIAVAGTYRYSGALRGTITLEQTGSDVRIVKTTYENANDRPLVGAGTLVGNVLEARLVPENGDRNYEALVTFVFGDGGDSFCVSFSDTNGDRGALGSYTGRR